MTRSTKSSWLAALVLLIGGFLPAAQRAAAKTTAPDSGEVTFVGAGDIADCVLPHDSATAALLDVISGTVYALGDNAYGVGAPAEFSNCYDPAWGRHKARTKPVPGNHDYYTPGAAGYYGYFGAAASPLDTNCVSDCRGYYSYDLGGWHIVALNSETARSASSAQIAWLKADLAANSGACTLAYWHKPLYSSGIHGDDASQKPFWDVLYRYGADIVLNGHDHHYERFAPQNPSGAFDPSRGIREFVVGTGGAALRALVATHPNSEARNSDTHGVLRFELRDGGYSWKFVPVAGKTFTDAGSANCVAGTNPAPVGYWRMDPVTAGGIRTANLATGIVDAVYQANATPGASPPDNNVGLPGVSAAGARARNKATAHFDGIDDHILVDANNTFSMSAGLTLAAWVKLDDLVENRSVVGKMLLNDPAQHSGYSLGVVNGELRAEVYDATGAHFPLSGGVIVTDTWTHLAATWQTGGGMAIYINGAQVATRTASTLQIGNASLPGNGDRVVMGGASWAPSIDNLAGSIDEVMIFDQALAPADIALIAQRTFIVNSASNSVTTCDGDACSLRTAIEHANAAPNGALKDRIHFDLPAPALIQPDAALPAITDTVRIDGLTQPGASCVAWPPEVKVALDGGASPAGTNGLSVAAPETEIAGLNVRNFKGNGIDLSSSANNAVITCNVIGADPSGATAAPNDSSGISAQLTTSATIQRNLISGNGAHGILFNAMQNGRIGGPGEGNHIANNAGAGVWITSTNAVGNWLAENTIHDNGGPGIDLQDPGVSPNDPGDADTAAANSLQNFPVLTAARADGKSLAITGTLSSISNTQYLIEYFTNPAAADCEGARFVGFARVATGANGEASVSITLTATVANGSKLSATATNLTTHDTSEFSACQAITVVGRAYLPLTAR